AWPKRLLLHPSRRWSSRPVRVTCGWGATGSGMAAGFGCPDIGSSRLIRTRFGFTAVGREAGTATAEWQGTGGKCSGNHRFLVDYRFFVDNNSAVWDSMAACTPVKLWTSIGIGSNRRLV